MPLAAIPPRMVQAVLAIEDRRFYDHPGVDPIGTTARSSPTSSAASKYLARRQHDHAAARAQHVPQRVLGHRARAGEDAEAQVPRVVDVDRARAPASKDEILELYLNDVSLGQRGSFAIHGVPEAARLFFGKDVSNLSLAEAATIAGVIQSPSALSPFNNPDRAQERRNVVLQAMADAGFITAGRRRARRRTSRCRSSQRALDAEAPYFVDFVGQALQEQYPG